MKNGTEPKRTISLTWDDPWKKYEERWRKNQRGEGKPLLFSDISRTKRTRRKKQNSKNQSLSNNGVNQWRPYL